MNPQLQAVIDDAKGLAARTAKTRFVIEAGPGAWLITDQQPALAQSHWMTMPNGSTYFHSGVAGRVSGVYYQGHPDRGPA